MSADHATTDSNAAATADTPADLQSQLAAARRELDEARETITKLERRQKIDALLAESEAIDTDVARLLTEVTVDGMDVPDVRLAVDDLRKHKPYLFRRAAAKAQSAAPAARAMPARDGDDASPESLAHEQARSTGLRADLLRYLRLKRRA